MRPLIISRSLADDCHHHWLLRVTLRFFFVSNPGFVPVWCHQRMRYCQCDALAEQSDSVTR